MIPKEGWQNVIVQYIVIFQPSLLKNLHFFVHYKQGGAACRLSCIIFYFADIFAPIADHRHSDDQPTYITILLNLDPLHWLQQLV